MKKKTIDLTENMELAHNMAGCPSGNRTCRTFHKQVQRLRHENCKIRSTYRSSQA